MKQLLQFRHATDVFRRVSLLIMAFMLLFIIAPDANATHFRGGTVTWQQAGGNTITVTVTTQWRRSFYVTNGFPQNVGNIVNLGSLNYEFTFGDGQIVPMNGTVVNAVDIANDISFMTWTYTKTYANPGNYNAIAFDNDCCRLSTLLNGNNDRPYELHTIINIGPPYNNPPVSSINPIINIPVNAAAATFNIPAIDPDNNPITFRLSTSAESGLLTLAPPGFSLATNGMVTFNTIGKAINQLFAVQVMVEDGLTKTPVDFMVKMVGPSAPPVFTSPAAGSVYNVTPPGNSVNFTVSAQDPDVGQFVTLQPVSVPVGSTMTLPLPVSGPVNGVATSNFSWTPTVGQVGTYVVNFVAQDDLGIQSFRSVTINVLCALDATETITNTNCASNNGSISVTPTNYSSLGNLVYSWSGPAGFVNPGNVSGISGLAPGTYNMRIDDIATGCFIIRNYIVLTNPDVLPPVMLSYIPSNPVTLSQQGRATTYSNVSLSGGPNYILVAPNSSVTLTANFNSFYDGGAGCPGCITQHYIQLTNIFSICNNAGYGGGSINQTFNAPSTPGVYYITQNSTWWYYCNQFGVPLYNSTPTDAIAVVVVQGASNCGAGITVNNNPGVCGAAVSYTTPVALDNCPGATVVQTGGLASGSVFPVGTTTNTFQATDASGNTATCSFTVTVNDTEAPVVTCTSGTQNTSDDGTGDCTFTPFLYGQGGSYGISDNCSGPYNIVEQFTGALNATLTWNLNQGGTPVQNFPVGVTNVLITVTDQSGNTSSCSYTTTIIDDEVPTITCPANVEFCYGDAVVTGNATATDNCGSAGITNDAPGSFAPGATTVIWTATDAAGNSSTCTQLVTVHLLNASTSVVDVLCYGENTGSISVTAFSIPVANPADILYSLDGGATTQTSNVFNDLVAGVYTVTVINTATNCTASTGAVITEPSSPVSVSVTSFTPSCYGLSTGTATALGSGGTPGYTYEWENSLGVKVSLNDVAGSLSPGTYTVIVTDANGCTATATAAIAELPPVVVDLGPDKVIFYGALGYNGCHTLTPVITGATAPVSYNWSSANPNPSIPLTSGGSLNICVTTEITYSYTVIVTDANGCTGSATVNVTYANIDCSNNQNAGKVTICTVPPGNPGNCNTICVSVSAAAALLANGGYVGPCLPNCAQPGARTNTSAPVVIDAELNIYPNPASSSVNIEYLSETDNAETLLITDLQGRMIENINISGAFEYKGVIDISNYDNGIYFINIMSNNSILKAAKLVKTE